MTRTKQIRTAVPMPMVEVESVWSWFVNNSLYPSFSRNVRNNWRYISRFSSSENDSNLETLDNILRNLWKNNGSYEFTWGSILHNLLARILLGWLEFLRHWFQCMYKYYVNLYWFRICFVTLFLLFVNEPDEPSAIDRMGSQCTGLFVICATLFISYQGNISLNYLYYS